MHRLAGRSRPGTGTPGHKVVVITGSSSGIGRGAALAFAARGDRVVLAARSAQKLTEAAAECRELGGAALAVPTDVSDEAAVQELVRRAVKEFGRIDVWVNAAAVWSYGRFEDTPPAVFRQIIETTLFGQVHAVRAVLPQFRAQGYGVLVNVASLYGRVSSPYVAPYVTAKWGSSASPTCCAKNCATHPASRSAPSCPGRSTPRSTDTPRTTSDARSGRSHL